MEEAGRKIKTGENIHLGSQNKHNQGEVENQKVLFMQCATVFHFSHQQLDKLNREMGQQTLQGKQIIIHNNYFVVAILPMAGWLGPEYHQLGPHPC